MKLDHQFLARGLLLTLALVICGGPALAQVRGDITESGFERKLKGAQDSAFTPWMPAKEANEVLRRAELDGKLVLAVELNAEGNLRVLLHFPPDGKRGNVDYHFALTEEQVLQRHANYLKQDYNALFVRKNPTGTYTGLWIVSERFGVAVKRMNELGISAPSIRLKESPAVADVPVATTVVVMTPVREWRDKSGRPLQASVSGVENGTVNFIRSDGRKVPYPLADLSEADQKYIAELQSKAAAGSSGGREDSMEGISKWMSRADFDDLMSDQLGKGLVPIYAESNFRNEMRAVFVMKPEPWGYFLGWKLPELLLREQHASYKSQGYTLLSLSYDRRSEKYCAVWVGSRALENGKAVLTKLGITLPSIDAKITVSEVPKR